MIRLEIYGILILAFGITLLLALVTFDARDITGSRHVGNLIGPIGAHIADLFLGGIGIGAFFFAGALGWLGVGYLIGRRARMTKVDVFGWLGALLGMAILVHVWFAPTRVLDHLPGGMLGEYVGEILSAFLSTWGTVILALTILIVSTVALTRRSLMELLAIAGKGGLFVGGHVKGLMSMGEGDYDDDEYDDAYDDEAYDEAEDDPAIAAAASAVAAKNARAKTANERRAAKQAETASEGAGAERELLISEPMPAAASKTDAPAAAADTKSEPPPVRPKAKAKAHSGKAKAASAPEEAAPAPEEAAAAPVAAAPAAEKADADGDDGDFRIVESQAMRRSRDLVVGEQLGLPDDNPLLEQPYVLPSLHMLDYKAPEGQSFDREVLRENAQILELKLADYGVKGKVVEIHPGPVITMYEFKPAPGVKISKISGLSDDLAMALAALRIRIVAPIPGKSVVGIEVPNKRREIVWLKEILSDTSYSRAKSKLTLALGKDIAGNPAVMDLGKAPHLLVAGATGSGKSVAINAFICSLLYSSTPDDVRMIMIDPKMIELSVYEGIPHLLLPVVTDPAQASTALRWAVKEMERRYRQLADFGVRNLANFNAKVDSILEDPTQVLPERIRMARARRVARGENDMEGEILDCNDTQIARMPAIVVIVDEFADLMMVAGKDVEFCVARLAQKARAAGIHLILATQRPSVDVITGMIKANFPTRVAFRVASGIDSRTILDQKGAENLLGMGDMLYLPPGSSSVTRVHGAYVSEEEVHKIVSHLKTQGKPEYDLSILTKDDEEKDPKKRGDDDDNDELYDTALRIVAETRNASISFLQRKLKIGYNRAARMVEQLEEEGIVGPSDGTSRPREVFIEPI